MELNFIEPKRLQFRALGEKNTSSRRLDSSIMYQSLIRFYIQRVRYVLPKIKTTDWGYNVFVVSLTRFIYSAIYVQEK